ncbi:hypothetical protein THAOC_06351 [Thalassiosira oceanica]|uniref:Myosin motor domain-containing protein n=1 Tax=Thalassiosira oceanica TaxID=159749 RepID=K0T4V7_THAOC|nr:hypothetical protein THAOC_06351 [Thalassiosira oceanica]|eukprot:EJK72149.1 hypothetical protein THAOC_06351 [Thalassiosira oceanica]
MAPQLVDLTSGGSASYEDPSSCVDYGGLDDLIGLPVLDSSTILEAVRVRYARGSIYTNTGPILLAVNPLRDMGGLYSDATREGYRARGEGRPVTSDGGPERRPLSPPSSPGVSEPAARTSLPPHVYATADDAYRAMRRGMETSVLLSSSPGGARADAPADQSILVSGESGAGKTVSTKIVLDYLAMLSGRAAGEEEEMRRRSLSPRGLGPRSPRGPERGGGRRGGTSIEETVLRSNPVLEAFGNARTVRNDNSSRFGKYIDVSFAASGRLDGAAIDTYLLEKVRLVRPSEGERNYHVFYQLLASAARDGCAAGPPVRTSASTDWALDGRRRARVGRDRPVGRAGGRRAPALREHGVRPVRRRRIGGLPAGQGPERGRGVPPPGGRRRRARGRADPPGHHRGGRDDTDPPGRRVEREVPRGAHEGHLRSDVRLRRFEDQRSRPTPGGGRRLARRQAGRAEGAHRRPRHIRLRDIREEQPRAALHQPNERDAPADVQPVRLQARAARVREGGHTLRLRSVRGQPGRDRPDPVRGPRQIRRESEPAVRVGPVQRPALRGTRGVRHGGLAREERGQAPGEQRRADRGERLQPAEGDREIRPEGGQGRARVSGVRERRLPVRVAARRPPRPDRGDESALHPLPQAQRRHATGPLRVGHGRRAARVRGVLEAVRVSRAGYPTRYTHETFSARYYVLGSGDRSSRDTEELVGAIAREVYRSSTEAEINSNVHGTSFPASLDDYDGRDFTARCALAGLQMGRTKVFLRRNTLDKLEALRSGVLSKSAVVIQRIVRGAVTRSYVTAMKDEMTGAAVVLQRAARNLARRRYYLGRDRVVISAATAIQSAARGWMTRTWFDRHPKTVKMRSWIPYREFEGMERDMETMKLERVVLETAVDATRSELEETRRNAEFMQTELTSRLRGYETNAERLKEELKAETEGKMRLKSSFEAEAKVSNDSIDRLKAEVETLKEMNRSLQENVAEAEDKRDEAARELGAIAVTNSQLAEEKQQLNDKVSDLEQRNESLVAASDELRDELRDATETASRVQSDLREEVESSRNELRARQTCHSEEMACLQSQLEKTRDEAAGERREKDSKIKELESSLMLCKKEMDVVSAKLRSTTDEHDESVQEFTAKVSHLERRNESFLAEIEVASKTNAALLNEVEEAKDSSKRQLDELRVAHADELNASKRHVDDLKTCHKDELARLREELVAARLEIDAAKAEAVGLASALRQSREENVSLKTCHAESVRKVESLTDGLEQEARASTALRNELQEIREHAKKVRTTLNEELESTNDELCRLKTSITDELKSRQEALSMARDQNGTLAKECNSLKQTNATMESRLKSLRENFEPLQSREDQTMEDMIELIQRECSLLISKSQIAQEENLAIARRLESTQGQSAVLEYKVEKLSRQASRFSHAFHTIGNDAEKVVGVVAEGDRCHKIEADRDLESGFEVTVI